MMGLQLRTKISNDFLASWIPKLAIWSFYKDDNCLNTLIKMEQNIFITIVYSKPRDRNAFLLPSRHHPRHVISNLPSTGLKDITTMYANSRIFQDKVLKMK